MSVLKEPKICYRWDKKITEEITRKCLLSCVNGLPSIKSSSAHWWSCRAHSKIRGWRLESLPFPLWWHRCHHWPDRQLYLTFLLATDHQRPTPLPQTWNVASICLGGHGNNLGEHLILIIIIRDAAIGKMECKCRVDLLIKHWSAAAEQRVAADDDANEVLAGNFN